MRQPTDAGPFGTLTNPVGEPSGAVRAYHWDGGLRKAIRMAPPMPMITAMKRPWEIEHNTGCAPVVGEKGHPAACDSVSVAAIARRQTSDRAVAQLIDFNQGRCICGELIRHSRAIHNRGFPDTVFAQEDRARHGIRPSHSSAAPSRAKAVPG